MVVRACNCYEDDCVVFCCFCCFERPSYPFGNTYKHTLRPAMCNPYIAVWYPASASLPLLLKGATDGDNATRWACHWLVSTCRKSPLLAAHIVDSRYVRQWQLLWLLVCLSFCVRCWWCRPSYILYTVGYCSAWSYEPRSSDNAVLETLRRHVSITVASPTRTGDTWTTAHSHRTHSTVRAAVKVLLLLLLLQRSWRKNPQGETIVEWVWHMAI